MPCPKDEKIEAYLGGELDAQETADLLKHLKTCARCRKSAQQLISLRRALGAVVAEPPCPSKEEVLAYVQGSVTSSQKAALEEHLKGCLECRMTIADLRKVAETLSMTAQTDLAERAREAVRAIVIEVMPDPGKRFDRLWEHGEFIVAGLLSGEGRWNAGVVRQQVAGALGAGAAEPASVMALIAILTGLAVVREMTSGKVPRDEASVRAAVRRHAQNLGAGRGLLTKLSEELPGTLLKP
jgi:anti-sigma factor RsiW